MSDTLPETLEKLIAAIINDGVQENTQSLLLRSRQLANKTKKSHPKLSQKIGSILGHTSSLRSNEGKVRPIPVDADSRQKLLREEYPVALEYTPVWPTEIRGDLDLLLMEYQESERLVNAGLAPLKSVLLTGPPGCGKTTAARWIAGKLDLPLFTLDLATVMSSYLGKTGSNIRAVLDHAQQTPCVLLLDEFDAIAKRRDDEGDVGELKRLVTVLLQAIDDWPVNSLLVAATNHGSLLDPAVWRRFELVIDFPPPTPEQVSQYLEVELDVNLAHWLSLHIAPKSIAQLKISLQSIRKKMVLEEKTLHEALSEIFELKVKLEDLKETARVESVRHLHSQGLSQRKISDLTKISRPAVKKILEENCARDNSE